MLVVLQHQDYKYLFLLINFMFDIYLFGKVQKLTIGIQ